MAKLMKLYRNGNYFVELYDDGTKMRLSEEFPVPEFPETVDVTISKRCFNGCEYCYLDCKRNGKLAVVDDDKIRTMFNPNTEIALNINSLDCRSIIDHALNFVTLLHQNGNVVNITVNQKTFMENLDEFLEWKDCQIIKGIGISLTHQQEGFIEAVKKFPNAVIHTIAGVTTFDDYLWLGDEGLKLLILGYKEIGKGIDWRSKNYRLFCGNQIDLEDFIPNVFRLFDVVSFDNLALKQLEIRDKIGEEKYEKLFMGVEGEFSFYLDLVDGKFARSSTDSVTFPMMDSVNDMFKFIRMKYIDREFKA